MAEPTQLESLDLEKCFDIQGFANFMAAHFVAKCHTMNSSGMPQSGGMTGTLPLTFQNGGNWGGGAF